MTKSSGSISSKADLLPLLASLQMVLEALGEKTAEVEQLQEQLNALAEDKRAAESDRVWDRTLLASIGEGLIVIDGQGTIANANPSAAKMLGYTQKEMIGRWFPRMVQAFGEDGSTV